MACKGENVVAYGRLPSPANEVRTINIMAVHTSDDDRNKTQLELSRNQKRKLERFPRQNQPLDERLKFLEELLP